MHIEAISKPADVAETFGVTRRTVYRLFKKSKEYVTLKDRARSGRPRVTDVETDTQIVGKFRDHPFKTVRSAAIETNVSERTVVITLASAGSRNFYNVMSHGHQSHQTLILLNMSGHF